MPPLNGGGQCSMAIRASGMGLYCGVVWLSLENTTHLPQLQPRSVTLSQLRSLSVPQFFHL